MSTGTHASRGFSLVELMVALVVSLIVIAGAISLMVGQQRAFETTSADRYQQEIARVVLSHVGGNLRNAGFGVDPALAFDLGPMNNVRMDRAPGGQLFSTTSYPVAGGGGCVGLCRDSTNGPDEIVFFSRDPSFGPHPLTVGVTAASNRLTIALVPGQTNVAVQTGQVLQIACYTGSMSWAYVTVSGAPTANGDGTASIPITNLGSTNFPNQTAFLADTCFTATATVALVGGVFTVTPASLLTAAEVMKVDRYHYYVQAYDPNGNVRAFGNPNARPYLMFDQGLRDGGGNLVTSVVSPDVEDLQFEYIFPFDAVTPLVGATAGVALATDDTGLNLAPAAGCPAFSDATTSASRLNHHPGNIGAVRLGLVARSQTSDPTQTDPTVPAAGNRAVVNGPTGYTRFFIETTVAVPNLSAQAPYFPTWGTTSAAGTRTLNVGGG
jgi:type IV pilus assembly protein PilW